MLPNTDTAAPPALGVAAPDRAGFIELARARRVVPVIRRLVADTITPVGLYATLSADGPGTFLLESAEHGRSWSRWSFVGVASAATLTERDGSAVWLGQVPAGLPTAGDPLEVLATVLRELRTEPLPGLPPLTGGLVGYIGYDAVRRIEEFTEDPDTAEEIGAPELAMMLTADLAALDHHSGTVTLIANAINWDGSAERADAAYDDAVARLDRMTARLARPVTLPAAVFTEPAAGASIGQRRTPAAEFEEGVARIQEYIRAGQTEQVVLAQRFDVDLAGTDPAEIALRTYRALRATNPSPYMYVLNVPTPDETPLWIVGSSPESLATVRGGTVEMHPIAGTRHRGATPEADEALAAELMADEKELSEHEMLISLGRHDIGKVSAPGTVRVADAYRIERYSHVMHIVSTVIGDLADDRDALDAVLACFPAGTLSGAPKPRALEIIDELEPVRRGPYGGMVGYLDFAGDADAAIAIRTAVLSGSTAYVQAGAGVVAGSIPSHEDAECRNKAAAVLGAIAAARSWRETAAGHS